MLGEKPWCAFAYQFHKQPMYSGITMTIDFTYSVADHVDYSNYSGWRYVHKPKPGCMLRSKVHHMA